MKISVVVPIHNEEDCLPELHARLIATLEGLGLEHQIIFVNDGSSDRSLELMSRYAEADRRIVIINLSRNFGHQPALSAGLSYASGDVVVLMDGDLQDPPELIGTMLECWRDGHEVVIAMRRGRGEKGLRKVMFDIFYKVLGFLSDYPLPLNAGIFGLLDRRCVEEINRLSEHNRFLPGLRCWIGFRQGSVYYERSNRFAGEPKQSFWRLVKYGLDAIFSFSYKPLRVALVLGLAVFGLTFSYASVLVFLRVIGYNVVRGFTTPTVAILILGGIQLFTIGILGEYLGRIYDEVKRRPYYIVSGVVNISEVGASKGSS